MNWTAIIAITEVLGVIAVVISIIYLAIQVKQTNQIAEDSAYRSLFTTYSQHVNAVIDKNNRGVFIKALMEYDTIKGEEKLLFDQLMGIQVSMIESSLVSVDAHLLSDATLSDWGYFFQTRLLPYPGIRRWWNDAKGYFPPHVHTWIDLQIEKTDVNSDFWGIK